MQAGKSVAVALIGVCWPVFQHAAVAQDISLDRPIHVSPGLTGPLAKQQMPDPQQMPVFPPVGTICAGNPYCVTAPEGQDSDLGIGVMRDYLEAQ